ATGIDVLPSASLICPAGPLAGGGVVAAFTTALGCDSAELEPALFAARTSTLMRRPMSAEASTYVFEVAPATSAQFAPPSPQRRHWYENVIGCVPPHEPLRAVIVEPSRATPPTDGTDRTVGGLAEVVASAIPATPAKVAS